jgi:MFS family permease
MSARERTVSRYKLLHRRPFDNPNHERRRNGFPEEPAMNTMAAMPDTHAREGRRTVIALGWVSFFMDVSSEMIYPLLPVFLSSVLGVGSLTIGFLAGLSESMASFFRVASGIASDRLGKRKIVVILGYALSTASRPILALARGWGHVLAFRLVDRAGKGIRTPARDALIADATTADRYGRSYGIQRAMDTAGAVLGPALASGFLFLGLGYRSIFWLALAPAAIAILCIQLFVREPRRHATAAAAPAAGPAAGPIARPRLPRWKLSRDLKIFLAVTAIFSLGNSSNFFLVLRAKGLGVADDLIPLLYMTMSATYALVSYPAGRLADRYGKARIAFVGYFLYAAAYALFAAASGEPALWALFPLQGLYLGFTDGVGTAYLATLIGAERRATGFALYHTIIGAALLPASTIGGWLWERYSPAATFIAGAALALSAGVLFGLLLLRKRSMVAA